MERDHFGKDLGFLQGNPNFGLTYFSSIWCNCYACL